MSDTQVGGIAGAQLRAIVERIERLDEEIKAMNDDKRDVYAEAKANGFDTKVLKRVVAYRRKDPDAVEEEDAVFDLYLHALGSIPDGHGMTAATRARTKPAKQPEIAA